MVAVCASSKASFRHFNKGIFMRSILLYLLGVPIPIIILIALFWH
ncbi:hypothetical protein QF002_002063 [Paraburkholderia youngii]